jgi:hypothetical protein
LKRLRLPPSAIDQPPTMLSAESAKVCPRASAVDLQLVLAAREDQEAAAAREERAQVVERALVDVQHAVAGVARLQRRAARAVGDRHLVLAVPGRVAERRVVDHGRRHAAAVARIRQVVADGERRVAREAVAPVRGSVSVRPSTSAVTTGRPCGK